MQKVYDYSNLFEIANERADELENAPTAEGQDRYVAAKMALMQMQEAHKTEPNKSIEEIAQAYYDKALDILIAQQEKKLKDAETFCIVQKQNEKETAEVMENVKNQLLAETQAFKANQGFIFSLLDLRINGDVIEVANI